MDHEFLDVLEHFAQCARAVVLRGPNARFEMPGFNFALGQHVPHGALPVEAPPGVWETTFFVSIRNVHVQVVIVHGLVLQIAVLVVAELRCIQRREDGQGVVVVHKGILPAANGVNAVHLGALWHWTAPVNLHWFWRKVEDVQHLGRQLGLESVESGGARYLLLFALLGVAGSAQGLHVALVVEAAFSQWNDVVHVEFGTKGVAAAGALALITHADSLPNGRGHKFASVDREFHDHSVGHYRQILTPVRHAQPVLLLEFIAQDLQGLGVVGDHADLDLELLLSLALRARGLVLVLVEDEAGDLVGVAHFGEEAWNVLVLLQGLLQHLDLGGRNIEGFRLFGCKRLLQALKWHKWVFLVVFLQLLLVHLQDFGIDSASLAPREPLHV